MNLVDTFFYKHQEPALSTMLALRELIQKQDPEVTEVLRYGMPFYLIRGRRFCYIWLDKRSGDPYIGFVDGDKLDDPALIKGERKKMKIFEVNASADLPVGQIQRLLQQALNLH
ncbi:uncharacterized protein DUF1801 [Dyadobacter jejuensis]|uniref:Uncharacterized protein DUF1801 n=1 Tax=Dyadobacter jejuensis TaxID=1082580 RepID=A0A316AJF2_9BACT|nr:DUF1801 domain-containing protein [Dyadobacter jejuensis]PWJ57448.1 uncharacterized protein DUF1801 [Dyadobacter jejuensis]